MVTFYYASLNLLPGNIDIELQINKDICSITFFNMDITSVRQF